MNFYSYHIIKHRIIINFYLRTLQISNLQYVLLYKQKSELRICRPQYLDDKEEYIENTLRFF